MGKLDKMLKLVDLLNHRRWVTLETIMNTCGIPRRTAFRYLTAISEADIPVFYDRERKAYSLSRDHGLLGSSFGLGGTLLLVLALRLLARHVNGSYRRDIEDLVSQVLVRQEFPLEDVVETFEDRIREESAAADHSPLLTAMLLNAAVRSEKRVKLNVDCGKHRSGQVDVIRPRLLFRRTWQVVDAAEGENGAEATATSLEDVTKVTIS